MFGNKKNKAFKEWEKGCICMHEGDEGKARIHFQEAVHLHPEHSKYWYHLGICLRELSKKYGVILTTDKTSSDIEVHTDDPLVQAYESFREYSKRSPSSHAFGILGDIAFEGKSYLQSIALYEKAMSCLKPEDAESEFLLMNKEGNVTGKFNSASMVEQKSGFLTNIASCHAEMLYNIMNGTDLGEKILTSVGYFEDNDMIVDILNSKPSIPKKEFLKTCAERVLYYYEAAYDTWPEFEVARNNYESFRDFYLKNFSDYEWQE